MVFSSNIFLFLFLPAYLLAYYLTPCRYRSWTILVGSCVFYGWWRVDFLFLFAGVILWNYLVGRMIDTCGSRSPAARHWVTAGIAVDLMILGYFKYAGFGISAINQVLASLGLQPLGSLEIILPVGISFYIFQAISYLVDVYRGDTAATRRFIDFAAFIALFPQLIAGPVLRYKDLAGQFRSRTHSVEKFSEGSGRFMQGFIRKVFIADTLAPLVDHCFRLAHPTTADAWLGSLAYGVQLYFDFSGYSDMAIGLGLMMGFRFVENFNQPYFSHSITEFWQRWHISLSTWLRDYLYIPLGGNRGGMARTCRNLFVTMLLGGFWHGANWTFLAWGGWHGLWLALERATGNAVRESRRIRPMRLAWTNLLILVGWVLFRSDDLGRAGTMLGAMFSFDLSGLSLVFREEITGLQVATLVLACGVILVSGIWQRLDHAMLPGLVRRGAVRYASALFLPPLFWLSILKLSAQSYSPFLYFQF